MWFHFLSFLSTSVILLFKHFLVVALEYTTHLKKIQVCFHITLYYFKGESVLVTQFVWLFVTPWTVAHQVLLSMKYSRQEY